MLYVISEDSGAGKIFWERFFEARQITHKMYTTHGNSLYYFMIIFMVILMNLGRKVSVICWQKN